MGALHVTRWSSHHHFISGMRGMTGHRALGWYLELTLPAQYDQKWSQWRLHTPSWRGMQYLLSKESVR